MDFLSPRYYLELSCAAIYYFLYSKSLKLEKACDLEKNATDQIIHSRLGKCSTKC